MTLIADRFLQTADGHTLDLASGESVWVRMHSAGGPSDEARWLRRCARFASLRHRSMAVLVDYGALGETRRFEAWLTAGEWRESTLEGERAAAMARGFLESLGLSSGTSTCLGVHNGRPVLVPSDDAGDEVQAPAGAASVAADRSGEACGIELLPRQCTGPIVERIAMAGPQALRVFSVWAPDGSGRRTALLDIARSARLHGYVPLGTAAWAHREAIDKDRSVVLLATGSSADSWRAFLDLSLSSRRPHVLVIAGEQEVPRAQAFALEQYDAETLAAAVRPVPSPQRRRVLVGLARRADGWPGRFARLLFDQPARRDTTGQGGISRASEAPALYVVDRTPATGSSARVWPVAADVLSLRQRQADAVDHLTAGLHVRGERLLRQALGGLARRADWPHAATGALALVGGLLRRGRCRDALVAADTARRYAARAGDAQLQLELSALVGRAELDLLHLDEAESVLESGLAAARTMGAASAERRLALELSRCLFWRGRYEAAAAVLSRCEDGAPLEERVWLTMAQARVALGRGQLAEAVSTAMEAVTLATTSGDPRRTSAASAAAALAHLAVGDHDALQRDLATGLSAARAAHEPRSALRLRLLQAELCRRTGRRAEAARLLARLGQHGARQMPPIIRARLDLVSSLLQDDSVETALRHAAATGLMSLSLFAPRQHVSGPRSSMRHLVEILRCCQSAEEDARILKTMIVRLKEGVQAVAAALFAEERGQLTLVASEGPRIERECAERVRTLGDVLGPRAGTAGMDGGVPVRYGDRLVGVIAVRWARPERCDPRECIELLATAAVAAGPALAAEQARRQSRNGGIAELLGPSAAMERVRAGIERAAPAPFAVLIEGESGTGKELVARAIHRRSPRRERTCCTVNCAALPDELLESELFGHARGAFTGAMSERPGVFDEAHGGTLFLDEIGELSLRAQAKVLRAIQEGEVRRVGENVARRVDVRILAAANRDLRQDVAAGKFRLDLLYRLDVIRIALPALRDRVDDLPVLVEHFWRDAATRVGSRATLSVATIAALARYHWPGNVRELQNVLAALAVRCPRRGIVTPSALPPIFDGRQSDHACRLDAARRTFEASFVRAALARAGGHRTRAAEELGVTRQGLAKLITRLGLIESDRQTVGLD